MAFLDETGLTELWSLIKSNDAAAITSAVSQAVAKDMKVESGTYAGVGSSKKTITFSGTPQIVMLMSRSGDHGVRPASNGGWMYDYGGYLITNGQTKVYADTTPINVSCGGNSLSIDAGDYTLFGMNASGNTYKYIAVCTY